MSYGNSTPRVSSSNSSTGSQEHDAAAAGYRREVDVRLEAIDSLSGKGVHDVVSAQEAEALASHVYLLAG